MTLNGLDLRYVAGVSWPRSGHHLLKRLLGGYFGDAFGYCEFYSPQDCCKTFPCARAGAISLSKNHDFDLKLPQIAGQAYLIQYRDFLNSVVSNFDLHVANGNPDTEESFRNFASWQWDGYLGFRDKWVTSDFAKSQLVMHYDDLTRDPVGATAQAIGLFAPGHVIDWTRLIRVVETISRRSFKDGVERETVQAGVANARVLSEFRFYSEPLFEELSNLSLTRNEVNQTCIRLLKRAPILAEVLRLQGCPDLATLEAMLRDDPKYIR